MLNLRYKVHQSVDVESFNAYRIYRIEQLRIKINHKIICSYRFMLTFNGATPSISNDGRDNTITDDDQHTDSVPIY